MATSQTTLVDASDAAEALDTDLSATEPETTAGKQVKDVLIMNRERIAERLEGRGGGLRTSMPDTDDDTPLTRYVCRWAQFHAGINTSMPVTASFELQEWIDVQGIDASVSGITDDAGDEVCALIDVLVDDLLVNHFEMDPTVAAREWKGAGLFE